MNLEKIIIQTLNEYQFGDNLKNGDYVTGVKKMYFGEVAAMVVKKYNDIPNVRLSSDKLSVIEKAHFEAENPIETISMDDHEYYNRFLKGINNQGFDLIRVDES